MIQMPNEDAIKEHQRIQKARIFDQFRHPEVKKSISVEEFGDKYSTGYKFYSEKTIDQFKDDFLKSEDANQELLDQNLSKVEKINVEVSKGEVTTFFVEKIDESSD